MLICASAQAGNPNDSLHALIHRDTPEPLPTYPLIIHNSESVPSRGERQVQRAKPQRLAGATHTYKRARTCTRIYTDTIVRTQYKNKHKDKRQKETCEKQKHTRINSIKKEPQQRAMRSATERGCGTDHK